MADEPVSLLIVEDEAIVAADLGSKLRQLGYAVVGIASEGAQAVELVGRLAPRLVLMDIRLEGKMDGIEAAERIRARFDLPVIYLTAHSDAATLARAKLTGPCGYILKPFEERDLAAQIELALHKHRIDAELARQRRMLQCIYDNIPVLLVRWDARLERFELNRLAEQVLGWSTDEANAGDFLARLYPDPGCRARVIDFMRALEPGWREWEVTTKAGERVPVEWANIRLSDDMMIGIGVDLRESKAAEKALRESEERLRRAMLAGRVFIFDWDTKTGAMFWSENCRTVLGFVPDSGGRGAGRLTHIHAEDRQTFLEAVERLTPARPDYAVLYRFVSDRGATVWLEESGRAEFDADGTLSRVRGIAADVTDRVEAHARETKAAAAIAAANSAIDTVNAMGEGVVLFRLDGVVTAVNPSAVALVGLPPDDAIGIDMRMLLPKVLEGEDLAMAATALQEAMAGRVPLLKHVVLRTDRRKPVCVSLSVTFIKSSDGAPVSGVLTLKDVTELHESNELLSRIFETTHMQIAYLDRDFNFLRVNPAYADAAQRPPEFFEGKNHFDIYPHAENEAIFRQVRDTREPFAIYEKPFEYPDQPERGVTYWDWSVRAVTDDHGRSQGVLLCLLDVTERVRTRQRFIQSEEQYRELVECANSVIMRLTPDHHISFFNDYAQRFFGYTAEEVLGRHVVGTILPETDSRGRDLRAMTVAISAYPEQYSSNENENMCKDGRRVWLHWSNRGIRDAAGAVREILCVGTDITERRRLEEEAVDYRRRLRALADRLNATEEQERRRVSTHIHDTVIQTLSLANIRLGGLRESVERASLADECPKVDQIRSLLDTGIAECRCLMADLTPPLLYEIGLVPALADFAEKQEALHGARIAVEEMPGCPPLDEGRRGLLFQCARELVMNAIKYAGPCEIRVSLSAADGEEVRLDVRDSGKGFDPGSVDLFVPHANGGFGLFNIRERLQRLDGSLAIDSRPGQGTTATIRVPV